MFDKKIFDLFEFEQGVSSNGVPVYVKNLPWINGWAEIRALIRVGSRWDPIGKEGLAHFLEHMLFKGNAKVSTEKALRKIAGKLLGNFLGGHTNVDFTYIDCRTLIRDMSGTMEFLRHLIFFPVINSKEVESERPVILREFWSKIKSQKGLEYQRFYLPNVYYDHPVGRAPNNLGYPETIASIKRKDLFEFHETYYHPGNIALVFVGDINLKQAQRFIEILTKNLIRRQPITPPVKIIHWPKPAQPEYRISMEEWTKSEAKMQYAYIGGERIIGRQDNFSILPTLNRTLNNILFEELRIRQGLCYSVGATSYDFIDHHHWNIEAKVEPSKSAEALYLIKKVLSAFASRRGYKNKFHNNKIESIRRFDMQEWSASEIADSAMNDIVFENGKITSLREARAKRLAVSYEDLQRLVAEELTPDKIFWIIVNP